MLMYRLCILCLRSCLLVSVTFFFFKQKTAYEMRISDWSSDVCSSDLAAEHTHQPACAHCGHIAQGKQGALQGIRRMRVIDHNQRSGPNCASPGKRDRKSVG